MVWDVAPDHWDATACRIAGRNLTRAEWNQYLPGRPYQATCPTRPAGSSSGTARAVGQSIPWPNRRHDATPCSSWTLVGDLWRSPRVETSDLNSPFRSH